MVAVVIPVPVAKIACSPAAYIKLSACVSVKPAYNIKQCSLAAARLTEYRYKFAFAKFNAHAFKRVHRGIPCNIIFFDIF